MAETLTKDLEDGLDFEETCRALSAIARAEMGDYFDENRELSWSRIAENPHPVHEVEVRIDPDGNTVYRLKLHDRIRAIERLAKLLDWDAPTRIRLNIEFKETDS